MEVNPYASPRGVAWTRAGFTPLWLPWVWWLLCLALVASFVAATYPVWFVRNERAEARDYLCLFAWGYALAVILDPLIRSCWPWAS
jgi:hypothetical protein